MKSKPLRIVVAGSGGRLGSSLVNALQQRHQVIGLGRDRLNLANPDSIATALDHLEYDHLILTAALTAVDYCETHRDEAFAVNAIAPGRIAEIAAAKGAHVTYISTDMVFDGLKGSSYAETDEPNPISVYGASKLEGEHRVLAASSDNLVARVSWVFGPSRPAFPEWIIQQARIKDDVTLPADKIGNPTYTEDLVQWLEALLFGNDEGRAAGIYHLCNSNPCTWRDWGQFCIDVAHEAGVTLLCREIRGVPVDSVDAFIAKRPPNSALETDKFTRATGIHPRPWQQSIREHVMRFSATIS
jgi:dTDP-4-dehydrorhamnose reductase